MPDEKPSTPAVKPTAITDLEITIHIPEDLHLTQELVDLHKDKFRVEMKGTIGNKMNARFVVNPKDSPSTDY